MVCGLQPGLHKTETFRLCYKINLVFVLNLKSIVMEHINEGIPSMQNSNQCVIFKHLVNLMPFHIMYLAR